ncbi:MAG: hypothetical protein ACR2NN_26335 [Bryobacteraceae bacterium]
MRKEEIQITKRKRVIAKLPPEAPFTGKRPDFLARLKKIYGAKMLGISGAGLLAKDRGRY